jgi:hypothetical protein
MFFSVDFSFSSFSFCIFSFLFKKGVKFQQKDFNIVGGKHNPDQIGLGWSMPTTIPLCGICRWVTLTLKKLATKL